MYKLVDIEKSLQNIDVVVATSARFRNKNIKHIHLEDLTFFSHYSKSNQKN